MVDVPPILRERARQLGTPGRRWLAYLPELLAELARDWSLTVGAPIAGGTAAYVARARTADGREAVLKLLLPDPDLAGQVRTMAEARGNGYARVYAYDPDRYAVLMEALGPSMAALGLPPADAIRTACATLRYAWRVAPWPELVAAPIRDKARELARLVGDLWEELAHPCPEPVVAQALRYAERRSVAARPERYVVVHGDPHPGNALRVPAPRPGAGSGFAFVDPDGFLGEPAYDVGVLLRDWCPYLRGDGALATARRYCRLAAGYTGVDETAIWQWSFLERVSTGLYLMRLGARDPALPFLTTAGRLVEPER